MVKRVLSRRGKKRSVYWRQLRINNKCARTISTQHLSRKMARTIPGVFGIARTFCNSSRRMLNVLLGFSGFGEHKRH